MNKADIFELLFGGMFIIVYLVGKLSYRKGYNNGYSNAIEAVEESRD